LNRNCSKLGKKAGQVKVGGADAHEDWRGEFHFGSILTNMRRISNWTNLALAAFPGFYKTMTFVLYPSA